MLSLEKFNKKILDSKGQLSIEFILILMVVILIFLSTYSVIINENEVNTAIEAAKSGAIEGVLVDSMAVYTNNEYYIVSSDETLTHPKYIKILSIDYSYEGFNSEFQRPAIGIQVKATSNLYLNENEKSKLSQKINTRIRRSIVYTFNTLNYTEEPNYYTCYSNHYCFITHEVVWV